jgi:hypothetical protein
VYVSAVDAVNVYQSSLPVSLVPAQWLAGIPTLGVDVEVLPDTDTPAVRTVADAQLSFAKTEDAAPAHRHKAIAERHIDIWTSLSSLFRALSARWHGFAPHLLFESRRESSRTKTIR